MSRAFGCVMVLALCGAAPPTVRLPDGAVTRFGSTRFWAGQTLAGPVW